MARIRNAVILGALLVGAVFLITFLQRDDTTEVASEDTTTTSSTGPTTTVKTGTAPCPKADGSSERKTEFDGPPRDCTSKTSTYIAEVETDVGTFEVALDSKKAPKTVNNFVFLARYHYYDGVTFHRVIPSFVVQGGDPKGDGTGGPGYDFADELPKADEYEIGSLAMANSGPDTNGSQFFVITGQQGVQLPPSYSLFGKVTKGLDVVKKIEADGTPEGAPKKTHKMIKVTITETK